MTTSLSRVIDRWVGRLGRIPVKLLSVAAIVSLFDAGSSFCQSNLHPNSGPALRFEQISIEEGLSQSWVWCIVQDSRGFLWIGTRDGLNRYDGFGFTVYKHDPRNPKSLSNNIVTALYEDRSGQLWIGTEGGGLNRFDHVHETFETYRHNPDNDSSISYDSITSIFEDASGFLWIGTSGGGLNRLDRMTGTFRHFTNRPGDSESISDNWILAILEDRTGILWVGTRGGLNRFDRRTQVFKRYVPDPRNQQSINNNAVSSLHEDESGTLWVGTWAGMNKFNRENQQFIGFLIDTSNRRPMVMAFVEDHENILWVATSGRGLYRYDPRTGTSQHYVTDPGNPNGLRSDLITSVCQDRSGLLWFGTKSHGVLKHDPRTRQFRHYRHLPLNSKSLSGDYVRTFFETEDGDIWIGTGTGGLNRFVRGREEFRRYTPDLANQNSLSNPDVITVKGDQSGRLWIGTGGGGFNRLDTRRNTFKRYFPNNSQQLNDNVIYSLCFGSSGLLWIGSWGGLTSFDPVQETYRHFQHDPNDSRSLSDDFVRTVYEDRRGTLWIGTNLGGLNKYDPESDTFIRYVHQPGNPNSISHNTIECMYEDTHGNFWIGTFGGGLNRFDRENEQFKYYSEENGLPNNVVHGILEDDENNLWISTNNGLSRFNPGTGTFKNFDFKDGLQSNEFTTNAYYKTRNGEMFFGGINGFTVFHPDSIRSNPFSPPVVITDFRILNERVLVNEPDDEGRIILKQSINDTDHLQLSHKDYVFSFQFASLDFTNPGKNQYQYIMEGFDPDWIRSGNRRFVTYTNLDPGEYTFRVRASNNDGVWNETGASISITITPPFWQTWWFRSVVIISILLSGYAFHRKRVNTIENKKKELATQVEEKTKAAEILQNALDEVEHLKNQLHADNIYLQDEIRIEHNFEDIITRGGTFKRVLNQVQQVAATDATVLILGESGTGKELVSRAVHSVSNRAGRPLVKVNCSTLPEHLIESELFGHEKGAFTGAISQKIGRFELADGGTVFLDEIGDLPLGLQAKLLRVLQEGEFERLGNPKTIKVNVRVIAATNRDLEKETKNGEFREDLYYRLNVFPIHLPPLRERKEDIPLLVKHFVQKYSARSGKQVELVTQNVIDTLQAYHWPGNVRELENIIERAVIITHGNKLILGDWLSRTEPQAEEQHIPTLEELERKHIVGVLELTGWRIRGNGGAASILNMKPTTLASRMSKLGIKRNQ